MRAMPLWSREQLTWNSHVLQVNKAAVQDELNVRI